MERRVLERIINGSKVLFNVSIYEGAQEAIKYNWDSLAFASNESDFISIEANGYCFSLGTYDSVEILGNNSDNDEIVYTNSDFELIRELIDNKELYSDKYEFNSVNSFYVDYGVILNKTDDVYEFDRLEDPISFTYSPKSIDELVENFSSFVADILSSIADNYTVIGEILEDGTIERGSSNQGLVYWNAWAFKSKQGVCYVPELSDTEYTYDDFLRVAKGNEKIAEQLFQTVDWQSPETVYDEWINDDEVNECNNCGKSYLSYDVIRCPYCNSPKVL